MAVKPGVGRDLTAGNSWLQLPLRGRSVAWESDRTEPIYILLSTLFDLPAQCARIVKYSSRRSLTGSGGARISPLLNGAWDGGYAAGPSALLFDIVDRMHGLTASGLSGAFGFGLRKRFAS